MGPPSASAGTSSCLLARLSIGVTGTKTQNSIVEPCMPTADVSQASGHQTAEPQSILGKCPRGWFLILRAECRLCFAARLASHPMTRMQDLEGHECGVTGKDGCHTAGVSAGCGSGVPEERE